MPQTERETLFSVFRQVGQEPLELRSAEGGTVVCLPYGGRMLALYAQEGGPDLFWLNPRLRAADTARAAFQDSAWLNLGGDRSWVGPELDTHIGDPADPWGTYLVPADLDPGHYVVTRQGDGLAMTTRSRVPIHRQRIARDVEIEKTVRLIPNPLRYEAWAKPWLGEVAYAGYDLHTSLRLLATPGSAGQTSVSPEICLWNILVLPAGGQMLVPTTGPVAVRVYFGAPQTPRLHVGPRGVRYVIDGQERHKIGIAAASLYGRAGYLRTLADGSATLVVRNWHVDPSGKYIDVPWDNQDEFGYAFESYNDADGPQSFGELEYHAPAVGGATGSMACSDRCQVWGFHGPAAHIRSIAAALLGDGLVP